MLGEKKLNHLRNVFTILQELSRTARTGRESRHIDLLLDGIINYEKLTAKEEDVLVNVLFKGD